MEYLDPVETHQQYEKRYKDLHLEGRKWWEFICYNEPLDIDFIDFHYRNIDWHSLSRSPNLVEVIINKYFNRINWVEFSKTLRSEDIIRKYIDKVNIQCVCIYQKLSEEFMIEFAERLNWALISKHQKLSINFIKCNIDKVSPEYLKQNKQFSNSDRTKLAELIKSYQELT